MEIEKIFNELTKLINAITKLGQLDWFDYIQLTFAILGVGISAWAVWMAKRIPEKIAYNQDKIALFDKRFNAYNAFQTIETFVDLIKNEERVEEYRKILVMIFYDGNNVQFEVINAMLRFREIAKPIEHMMFLFNDISEFELEEILNNICGFINAIDIDKDVELYKQKCIKAVDNFCQKHNSDICGMLKVSS